MNTELFYCCHSEALKTLAQPFVWSGGILTLEQGAATRIYQAANDEQPSRKYWVDEAIRPMNPVAQDEDPGRDLWSCSETPLSV